MSREVARRVARAAIEAAGRSREAWAADADIDPKTLASFLSGERWPHATTRRRIELALAWPAGALVDIAEGVHPDDVLGHRRPAGPAAAAATTPAASLDLIEAIRHDPHLLPEAKEHLERQYGLLLRVQAAQVSTPAKTAAAIEDAKATVRSINAAKKSPAKRTVPKRR